MIKIGDRVINVDNITDIIDRNVFFNNGTSWVVTEPEIQMLLAELFNEPREKNTILKAIEETKKDLKDTNVKVERNAAVPSRNSTNKPKRVSK